MNHFTIDTENNITVHETKKEALEFVGKLTDDEGAHAAVFGREVEFADAIGNDNHRLIEIWNSLPGVTPVKKFTNRKIATERIWKVIQSLSGGESGAQEQAEHSAPADEQPAKKTTKKKTVRAKKSPAEREPKSKSEKVARDGTKTDKAIAMMKRKNGATIQELMEAFGWQAHTVRGFVAGTLTKKLGLTVVSSKPEGGDRTYTIE